MNELIVYHGGTERIEMPVCKFGRKNLDFGHGFYVTNLREQAVSWAYNMAKSRSFSVYLLKQGFTSENALKTDNLQVATAQNLPVGK